MIILPLTLALMLGLLALRFGRRGLARLAELNLRGSSLALLALVAQVISIITRQHRLELLLLSTVFLLGFCWRNRGRAGIFLITAGIVLNMTVMGLNGGMMPISPMTLARMTGQEIEPGSLLRFSKDTVVSDDQAALPWLGDRLLLPGPLAWLAAWSLGDVLLLAGVGRLLWTTMKGTEGDGYALRNNTTVS